MKLSKRGLLAAGAISGGAYVALAATPYYRIWQAFTCGAHSVDGELSVTCKNLLYPSDHDRLVQNLILALSYVFMAIFVLVVVAFVSGGYWNKKS
jgi:hypothetical protein